MKLSVISSACFAILFCLAACAGWGVQAADKAATPAKNNPVLLGVNMAGDYHLMHAGKDFYEYDAWFTAMAELGVQFVDNNFMLGHYLKPMNIDAEGVAERIRHFDQRMSAHGLKYVLNNELANWTPTLELAPGKNEFAHPDGTHRWDFRLAWLEPLLPPKHTETQALIGINYDEADHMILSNNAFSTPDGKNDTPYLVDTTGMKLDEAFIKLAAKCDEIRTKHYQNKLPIGAECGFSDMFPIFARAGWVVTPKLMKENLSAVSICTALGAALEYADTGTDLWVCNDLWNMPAFPGHSPQALRSGLLMSYWLGASRIFVENVDFSDSPKRHPKASPKGSLIAWKDLEHYELTHHGRVVQDFFKNYVPAHPRTINWRDYRPRVAIVRLPDGAWGQKGTWYRDRLLGDSTKPMDEASAEWLHVWPILTHGAARDGAICVQNEKIYPGGMKEFFMPVDSVAVFDHLVRGPVLDSVECFVVCGHALSGETFQAVKRRVEQGATCIIARRLYAQHAQGELPGKWLIVDDFKDPAIAQALKPYLGPADVARFRFKGQTVEFRQAGETDALTVSIKRNKRP